MLQIAIPHNKHTLYGAYAAKVKMSHVDEAINEMFQATHMRMMRNCCRLDQILLASILLESRSKGKCIV